jgi:hypothetical protein
VPSLPEDTNLARELLDAIERDLSQYANIENPNKKAAGDSAVRSFNAAIRVLDTARHHLLVELNRGFDMPDERALPQRAAGNSGPGPRSKVRES